MGLKLTKCQEINEHYDGYGLLDVYLLPGPKHAKLWHVPYEFSNNHVVQQLKISQSKLNAVPTLSTSPLN